MVAKFRIITFMKTLDSIEVYSKVPKNNKIFLDEEFKPKLFEIFDQ